MRFYQIRLLFVAAISFAAPATSLGITLGQIDTFEDGTHQGWFAYPGTGSNPPNGPGGSVDHYLSTSAPPSGSSGEIDVFNRSQWLGNYLAAGVTSVEMDLKNNNESFVTSPLQMRIAIRSGSNVNVGYSSTTAYILPRDDQWHHAVFSLKADSLTAVALENLSPPPLTDVLANVLEFHILNSSAPKTTGDTFIFGGLGIDNIRAVPEPAGIATVMTGLLMVRAWLTHKRSS